MTKKLIVGLAIASMLPFAVSAATVDELQAQINALMTQLSAAKPTTSASCSYVFTKTLKQGMSDAEVMNLQKVLNADVATQVASTGVGSAGNETMYFGAATKAALVKYQDKYASDILVPAGLSKGTGLLGASTRAHLNKCTTTATTTTTNTSSTTLSGGAGSFTATKYTSDVENTVVTGSSEIVLSFKGKAEGSDVKVTHLKLAIEKETSPTTGSTYINRYFKEFNVYANGTKVGTANVDGFTRDSSGKYSMTVALDNSIVKMGTSNQVIYTIKAVAVDSIDTENVDAQWQFTVSNIRYTDATGVILSSTDSIVDGDVVVNKLSSSGDVKVKISTGSSNPDEKTVFVSDTSSGDKVTMNEFKVKAEGTKISFDTVKANFVATSTANTLAKIATELQLVRGDTIIDTVDSTDTSGDVDETNDVVTFNIDTPQVVNQDETVTYKIVARLQKINTSTFALGDSLKISIPSTSSTTKAVNAEDKNGDTVTYDRFSGSSTGKAQTFRATGIDLSKSGSTAVAVESTQSANGYGKFSMDLKITASGDDLWIPMTNYRGASSTAGIAYQMENSSGNVVSTGTTTAAMTRISGGTDDGNYVKIADGENATIRLNISYDPAANGFARLQTLTVGYTTAGATGVATAAITGTPSSTFETDSVDIRI